MAKPHLTRKIIHPDTFDGQSTKGIDEIMMMDYLSHGDHHDNMSQLYDLYKCAPQGSTHSPCAPVPGEKLATCVCEK